MKILVKIVPDNVSYFNRSTKGYEFIKTVESNEEGYNMVSSIEDADFFPQENGFVLSGSGNEVFDPEHPNTFDFGDYTYYIEDINRLDSFDDAHIIRAIEAKNPLNLKEIKELID